MHNLFGDTNAVHINLNKNSGYKIETVIVGDTIAESLKFVQYDFNNILKKMRENLEKKVSSKKISIEDSITFLELYKRILEEYTYLM
jgi:arginine decarboxylase